MLDKTIETFLTVAECGSMNKAAARLYLSPTAVMNEINKLETRLGFSLFVRTNRGLTLTEAGDSLCRDAKRLADEAQMAILRAGRLALPQQFHIRVGSSHLRSCVPFLEAWNAVKDCCAETKITVVPFSDDSLEEIFHSLGKDFDIVGSICDITNWKRHFQFVRLWDSKFAVSVSRQHRLAERERLTLRDLEGERILFIQEGTSVIIDRIRRELLRNCSGIQIVDDSPHYDLGLFNRCAEEGILALSVDLWGNVHPSLRLIPVDWNYTIPYGIMYPLHPSPQLLRFLDSVRTAHMGAVYVQKNPPAHCGGGENGI